MIFKEFIMEKNEIFVILMATSDKTIDIKQFDNIKVTKIWKKGDKKLPNNNVLKYKNFGLKIEKKYQNKHYIQEILNDFFLIEDVKKFVKANLSKELLIVIYSWNMLPAIIYNSEFLKFLGDNDIKLSHDIYNLEL